MVANSAGRRSDNQENKLRLLGGTEERSLCFSPALWVNCLSQMGILEPDSQTKPSTTTTTPSPMYPCDMCFSPGALITHLEAIWDVNHRRRRRSIHRLI